MAYRGGQCTSDYARQLRCSTYDSRRVNHGGQKTADQAAKTFGRRDLLDSLPHGFAGRHCPNTTRRKGMGHRGPWKVAAHFPAASCQSHTSPFPVGGHQNSRRDAGNRFRLCPVRRTGLARKGALIPSTRHLPRYRRLLTAKPRAKHRHRTGPSLN